MLGGLVLSTSIPTAFEDRGLWFAGAYATMQIGRTLFWLIATPVYRTLVRHNAIRILAWLCSSAVFWILGGLAEGQRRLWLWIIALLIEYVAPLSRFWTPGLGYSAVEAWAVEGGHMAERCAGFIIIALGEAIVVNGATFADLAWTPENVGAVLAALIGSIAMWWIYFHRGAEAGTEMISKSAESGRVARLAYTYLHMPIVGRDHPDGRGRRIGPETPERPFRSQDGGEFGWGALAVPDRHDPVQAYDPRLPTTIPWRRYQRVCGAGPVCKRLFAAGTVS